MHPPGLLGLVPEPIVARIHDLASTRVVRVGSYLFQTGDRSDAVYLIEHGLIRVDRTTLAGRSVLLTLARTGDLVGEFSVIDRSQRSASCSAIEKSRVSRIPVAAWDELMREEPDFASAVTRLLVRRLRALTDQLVDASTLDARSRVAARLVDLIAIAGETGSEPFDLTMPISQQDLADWAGLSREGAVKGIRHLRQEGVIETGRKHIRVIQAATLRDLAGAGPV